MEIARTSAWALSPWKLVLTNAPTRLLEGLLGASHGEGQTPLERGLRSFLKGCADDDGESLLKVAETYDAPAQTIENIAVRQARPWTLQDG